MSESISEFLDGAEAALGAEEVAETGTATEPMTQAPAEVEDIDLDGDLPSSDMFDRKYVERVRGEAAKYRNELKAFKDAFNGYGEEEQQALMNLARTLRDDPRSAAQEMSAAAEQILAQYKEQEEAAEDDKGEYMTRADYQAMRQEELVDQEVRAIESEAKDLGYTLGSEDYEMLLLIAKRLPSGSIAEAHGKMQARGQAQIDKYVADKAKEAEGSVMPPTGGGAPSNASEPIKTFADARAKLEALMRSN